MKIKLTNNAYGKNAVNLSKIIRHADHHEFRQISVTVSLQGDFETAHTIGDNSKILPTDTQKNTVYALAKEHFTSSIEAFGLHLSNHFISNNQFSLLKGSSTKVASMGLIFCCIGLSFASEYESPRTSIMSKLFFTFGSFCCLRFF